MNINKGVVKKGILPFAQKPTWMFEIFKMLKLLLDFA